MANKPHDMEKTWFLSKENLLSGYLHTVVLFLSSVVFAESLLNHIFEKNKRFLLASDQGPFA